MAWPNAMRKRRRTVFGDGWFMRALISSGQNWRLHQAQPLTGSRVDSHVPRGAVQHHHPIMLVGVEPTGLLCVAPRGAERIRPGTLAGALAPTAQRRGAFHLLRY